MHDRFVRGDRSGQFVVLTHQTQGLQVVLVNGCDRQINSEGIHVWVVGNPETTLS
jgi:hypothetical protein